MTVKQVAKQLEIELDTCSYLLKEMFAQSLVRCLNEEARRSRVYWLTELGKRCRRTLREQEGLPHLGHDFPRMNWSVYGWVCFSHRSAIIKALDRPLQPAAIKRRARFQNPQIKMSANNVRDVIRLLIERKIVTPIIIGGKTHPRYQLTELGQKLQVLLLGAETRTPEAP